MLEKIKKIRRDLAFAHPGVNPIPTVRRFKPVSMGDVGAIMGLLGMLANEDLSEQDLKNIAGSMENDDLRLKALVEQYE